MKRPDKNHPVFSWPRWVKFADPVVGEFKLQLRKATVNEQLADQGYVGAMYYVQNPSELETARQRKRIETVVVGWEGVGEPDKPEPFSLKALWEYCDIFPSIMPQLVDLVSIAYQGLSADDRKNLSKPLTDTLQGNGRGTPSSSHGTVSEVLEVSHAP